jgi:hypothetical protein
MLVFLYGEDPIRLSTYNLQHFKYVNTLARSNTHSISIYDTIILNIYLARKLMFENWLS